MSKTVTLEIPQSELEKFNLELTRVVTLLQAQHRENDERQERLARLVSINERLRLELERERP